MKRIGNLFESIVNMDNLILADKVARKGKSGQYGVKLHDKNREGNIIDLHHSLTAKTYLTSPYSTFIVNEPKERLISCLPYFPDRIVHHAIMNVLEPIFVKSFTADTYSCIKGRGIHAASIKVKSYLKDVPGTTYCLKLDIRKFYPSIDHEILKNLLRRKFKDQDLLWLLDEIIDSSAGIPIGNYLSQFFANFYLTPFDRWIKESKKQKYYLRYADDIVIFSDSKPELHKLLHEIKTFLKDVLNLDVKSNYQVFPVESRGVNFVGYNHFHFYTLLRKTIKKRFAKAVSKRKNHQTIAAYNGWAKHCNSKHLLKKLLNAAL